MLQSILIISALGLSYFWVSLPTLSNYSLQLTAVLFLLYFVSKRFTSTKLHYVLPKPESFETALLTLAVAIIIGSTGSLESPFLPLFHLILFVSVLTNGLEANIIKMLGLFLFLWSTSTHPLTNSMWIELMSLPFLLPLMIFARLEFEEAREEKYLHQLEETVLGQQESRMLFFLSTFLKPKLRYIRQLLMTSEHNRPAAIQQILMVEKEIEQTLTEIDVASDTLDETPNTLDKATGSSEMK